MTGGKRKRSDEEGGEDEDEDEDVDVDVGSLTVGVAGRARNKLFEAIYRELFEHIYDYVAGPAKASAREVAAINISSTQGEKFAKVCSPQHGRREYRLEDCLGFQGFHESRCRCLGAGKYRCGFYRCQCVIKTPRKRKRKEKREYLGLTSQSLIAGAALWYNMYTREEHNRTLREHSFDKPLLVGAADLGVALVCGRISRADTTHETVQNTLRQWQRYNQTAEEIGWKMLAILSFSASFRQHTLVADELYWDRVFLDLQSLRVSIELVGDFFCPDWRDLVPFSSVVSMPGYDGHHHLWSVPLDKSALLAQPIQPYEILEKSILGENTLFDTDPMLLKRRVSKLGDPNLEEHCPICTNEKVGCDCPTRVWFPCRIELIQTKTRGVGIRTLQVSIIPVYYKNPSQE